MATNEATSRPDPWKAQREDLVAAWQRGYHPGHELPPEACQVLEAVRARILEAPDHQLLELARLVLVDQVEARAVLLRVVNEIETAARKAAAQTDRCMAAVAG
jgi:hypothetical protein